MDLQICNDCFTRVSELWPMGLFVFIFFFFFFFQKKGFDISCILSPKEINCMKFVPIFFPETAKSDLL